MNIIKTTILTLCIYCPAFATPILSENFNDISTLAGSGWVLINNSSPLGTTDWFQGLPGVFPAQSGAVDYYIAANFLNADAGGNISNWLISPQMVLNNGDTISFYTRSNGLFEDRLEVRLSAGGASAGGTAASVGDFTTLLTTVNPLLSGSYPSDWTLVTVTVSGLGGPAVSRVALRYALEDSNVNGDYIGVDTFLAESSVPEPGSLILMSFGLAALGVYRRRVR